MHKDQHEIGGLRTNLQPATAASQCEMGRMPPPVFGSATGHAASAAPANYETGFKDLRKDGDADRFVEHRIWNRLIRRSHDLLKNFRSFCSLFLRVFRVSCKKGRDYDKRKTQYGHEAARKFKLHVSSSGLVCKSERCRTVIVWDCHAKIFAEGRRHVNGSDITGRELGVAPHLGAVNCNEVEKRLLLFNPSWGVLPIRLWLFRSWPLFRRRSDQSIRWRLRLAKGPVYLRRSCRRRLQSRRS